jgi:ketosteroid isomerase-like protein
MSAEDVELVVRWFKGLGQGELTPEICDPEIVIRNWDESPVRGPFHGHEGLGQWWADLADAIEEMHFELNEATDLGDGRVLTTQQIVGRFRLTGIELDFPWGSIVTVREGKILSATGYATPGQAARAASPSESA